MTIISRDGPNEILNYIQEEKFKIVIVEGPRGSGKSTLCDFLLKYSNMYFYKTWGFDQRKDRFLLEDLGLDLPQGTYFALDLLTQIPMTNPVLVDRGIHSALAYQHGLWGQRSSLHIYYASLLFSCNACVLLLDAPTKLLIERRVGRKDKDEQNIYQLDKEEQYQTILHDQNLYETAIGLMETAGLRLTKEVKIESGASCQFFTPVGGNYV